MESQATVVAAKDPKDRPHVNTVRIFLNNRMRDNRFTNSSVIYMRMVARFGAESKQVKNRARKRR